MNKARLPLRAAEALLTRVQEGILYQLGFKTNGQSIKELMKATGFSFGGVHRELTRLVKAGFVTLDETKRIKTFCLVKNERLQHLYLASFGCVPVNAKTGGDLDERVVK